MYLLTFQYLFCLGSSTECQIELAVVICLKIRIQCRVCIYTSNHQVTCAHILCVLVTVCLLGSFVFDSLSLDHCVCNVYSYHQQCHQQRCIGQKQELFSVSVAHYIFPFVSSVCCFVQHTRANIPTSYTKRSPIRGLNAANDGMDEDRRKGLLWYLSLLLVL